MENLESRILYLTDQYALINKISGEICSLPKNDEEKKFYIPYVFAKYISNKNPSIKPDEIQCVNRIDRPVSGVVILALNPIANAALSNMVKRHDGVDKEYWAIIEGVYDKSDWISLSQYITYNQRAQKAHIEKKPVNGALPAILEYKIVGKGEKYTFLKVKLITGRTHQIRCQLSSLGYHIKGDLKYGSKRSEKNGGIRLHAANLSFTDPFSHTKVSVHAELPLIDSLWQAFSDSIKGNSHE